MKHAHDDAPLFKQTQPKGFNYRNMAAEVRPDVAARVRGHGTLDAARAKAERDAAIEQVASRAELRWLEAAQEAIRDVAATASTFTVDDVQALLAERGVVQPEEGRAMGAAIRWAVRNGLIEATGEYRASAQPQCHANPRPVWRRKQRQEAP